MTKSEIVQVFVNTILEEYGLFIADPQDIELFDKNKFLKALFSKNTENKIKELIKGD